jgi:hypothetical protein
MEQMETIRGNFTTFRVTLESVDAEWAGDPVPGGDRPVLELTLTAHIDAAPTDDLNYLDCAA